MVENFDALKKIIQRLEWWPEYDIENLRTFIAKENIGDEEIREIIKSLTLNPNSIYRRLEGSKEKADYFARSYEELKDLQRDWEKCYLHNYPKPQKICFITCFNKISELEEMRAWIKRLYIPEGIIVESREIENAKSMCSGYNEAMHSSDALFKVYLHQDVRILNPFFIYDLVLAFARHPDAGMIGVVGSATIPEDYIMWHGKRIGAIAETEYDDAEGLITYYEEHSSGEDKKAEFVDGLLMATRVDIDWRDDLFKDWDFYDASQSREFIQRGYEVIVPDQKLAWCLHDFGKLNYGRYEENRLIFIENYLKK